MDIWWPSYFEPIKCPLRLNFKRIKYTMIFIYK